MSNEYGKDIEITAYPNDNKATVFGHTEEGRAFIQSRYDKTAPIPINGDEVNGLIKALRNEKLSFSFKPVKVG